MNFRTLSAALLVAGATFANAGITLVSGDGLLVTSPSDMKYKGNAYNDATPAPVRYWTERSSYILDADLVVSSKAPVSFPTNITTQTSDSSLKIIKGTAIKVYYLYFDPAQDNVETRFKFDEPILGLITNEVSNASNNHFMLSDYLIDPTVPAANKSTTHFAARGLEMPGDYVRYHSANEFSVKWNASNPGDQMRVIAAVPEPGTIAAVGFGIAALIRRRRRQS